MINIPNAKRYCCDDIALIENYWQAVWDPFEMWECHHRLGVYYSVYELEAFGMYLNRPASELMFVTTSEHSSLHKKGEKHPFFNKHHTSEAIAKISEGNKGNKNAVGNKSNKGKTWITNGLVERYLKPDEPMPEGFVKGRLKNFTESIG